MIINVLILNSLLTFIESRLVQVHILFRHGDRAPLKNYLNDQVLESAWPNGFEQLTNIGIKQNYQLGKLIQERYKEFLDEIYSHKKIYVRSTDVDRTLMSAEATLAGIFSNTKDIIPGIKWRPFPVHTINETRDYLLSGENHCPKYNELYIEALNTRHFQKQITPYLTLIKLINKYSGTDNFLEVYDLLFCQRSHKMKPLSWLTENMWGQMTKLANIYWNAKYSTLILNQISAGVLLNQILEHLSMARTNSSLQPKVFVYSAHDTDVAPLYHLLNVPDKNFGQPGYASSIIIELHVDDMQNSNYQVKAWYGDTPSLTDDPWQIRQMKLDVEGCTDLDAGCPLDRFLNAMQRKCITLSKYIQICNIPPPVDSERQQIIYALQLFFVCSILGILLLCGTITYFNRKKYQNAHSTGIHYSRLASR